MNECLLTSLNLGRVIICFFFHVKKKVGRKRMNGYEQKSTNKQNKNTISLLSWGMGVTGTTVCMHSDLYERY